MSRYELVYFPMRGKAETSRLLLVAGGANWSNKTAQWPEEKDSMPFGQMPLLIEYNESGEEVIRLAQSHAIERYLARKFGLAGSNEIEIAILDSIIESIRDLHDAFIYYARKAPEVEKAAHRETYLNTTLPNGLKYLARFLEKNGNNRYYVGNKLSYAELYLYVLVEFATTFEGPEFIKPYPELQRVVDLVQKHTGVKQYVDSPDRVPIFKPPAGK
ncbi:hypothetical protein HK097_010137 [Rhizophlyctis rosea]|uniref:Glutathione S-transferase n=1 Tax=Rhizophlyctis rosea TaxID=64517 RepID=A0AAD5S7Y0_9FUNG|nr:hypothetical protein HK097_010137 [Rhizophlyctis rosea]